MSAAHPMPCSSSTEPAIAPEVDPKALMPSGTIREQQNKGGKLVRRVVTAIAALMSVLVFAPAADAQSPAPTVTVTEFGCASVTVSGAGWEQTDASVEVAVPPSEGGESRDDLIAGPVQVFPDAEGNIAPTVVPFNEPPPDGDYAAVVLVDNIVRGQSAGFTLTGCRAPTAPTPPTTGPPGAALPRTGSSTLPLLTIGLLLVGLGLAFVRRSRAS
jgi:LPXTG-motif cell wall-anchored protein